MLFGVTEGYLCLATTDPIAPKTSFVQQFFKWPSESIKAENWILRQESGHNVYFCVNLLNRMERKKDACLDTDLLWADLDSVNPESIAKIPPPIVIRSSMGRWQGIWRMTVPIPPFQAEDYSRRIAYLVGADTSGWDLTQLLRVPFTTNFKYDPSPTVELQAVSDIKARPLLFETLPATLDRAGNIYEPTAKMPDEDSGYEAQHVVYKYSPLLQRTAFYSLYTQDPPDDADWSTILWRLLNECFKVGMSAEETFTIAKDSNCNKYARDGRPIQHLWRDVLKCGEAYQQIEIDTQMIRMPKLVERSQLTHTFINTYREWATEATDAVPEFHDLCIFIVMSTIISNSVRLETSAGMMTPNIWGLILGDSTLTRKTTAMRLALDFLVAMDPDLLLATDGSAEGILQGLSTRPNRASVFHKDEVSGLFDSMAKKDYLAGFQETLTALYDVPPIYTRRLRRETIVIESPSFVFLGGGVANRVYQSVTEQFVLSGFLPRFIVVAGDAQVEDRRPLGPPSELGMMKKPKIQEALADLYETYATDIEIKIGGQKTRMPPRFTARLTPEAWQVYADFESTMLSAGKKSLMRDLALPTFDRLSRSLLKMSIILAASRQKPDPQTSGLTVEPQDLINSAWYIQEWGQNSINLIMNAGKGANEKFLERVYDYIMESPGISRSEIFKRFHLSSKDGLALLQTLEDRAQLRKEPRGVGHVYWII